MDRESASKTTDSSGEEEAENDFMRAVIPEQQLLRSLMVRHCETKEAAPTKSPPLPPRITYSGLSGIERDLFGERGGRGLPL